MATMEGSLVAQLLATSGVTTLVGQRIYPHVAPQGTLLAYVTYEAISKRIVHDHAGTVGLTEARISYLCHAPTYAGAKAIAAAILAALDRKRGTIQSTVFGAILSESEADAGYDDDLKMHVVAVDFRVLYQ